MSGVLSVITSSSDHKEFTYWRRTDDLVNPVSGYKPRVAYDLFGNVLIIQGIYLCTHGCSTHKEHALSVDIINSLTEVPVLVGL